jgi:hypothetical protein
LGIGTSPASKWSKWYSDWSPKQKADILKGKRPKHSGKTIQGHHSYSVSKYPLLADKGEIIYTATFNEHFNGLMAISVIVCQENPLKQ